MSNQLIDIILLDGLGINLKSSIVKKFRKSNYPVCYSNTIDYIENDKLFPFKGKYTTKFKSRLDLIQATYGIKLMWYGNEKPLIVDRSAFNNIIFGILTYGEYFDDYYHDEMEYQLLKDNIKEYLKIENQIGNIKRYLIKTFSEELLDHELSEEEYNKSDHAKLRGDAFWDRTHYLELQEKYFELYKSSGALYKEIELPKGLLIKDIPDYLDIVTDSIITDINILNNDNR